MAATQNLQSDEEIATFRRFNRLYTRTIGTLSEGLLNSQYSLTEARVLYELAHGRTAAREIAEELGLDPGYLSRILRRFEDTGLLKKTASAKDARQIQLFLTAKGKTAFNELDRRSDKQAANLLSQLTPSKREVLLRSMSEIERALSPDSSAAPYVLRQHRPGDMGWVVSRHGIL